MTKHVPLAQRREAVRLYHNSELTLRDVGQRFGVSKTAVERWLRELPPRSSRIPPPISFAPIVVEEPDDSLEDLPATATDIPVMLTTAAGSTLHFHLRSFDEIAALVRSLEKTC